MKIVFKSAENDYYIFTKKFLCWVAWESLMENDRWEAWRCFALKIFSSRIFQELEEETLRSLKMFLTLKIFEVKRKESDVNFNINI